MTSEKTIKRFFETVDRQLYIMLRIIEDEYQTAKKETKELNQWHDLRKDPTDLPESQNAVWVILSENPTEVEQDSYNPEDKGKVVTIPAYDLETDDGKIEHHESRQYEASGWWAYGEPGWITHWMYIDVPEPPEA